MNESGFIAWICMILQGKYFLVQNQAIYQSRFKDFSLLRKKVVIISCLHIWFPLRFRDVESGVQAIWDRASLVVINQEDRAKYVHIFSVILSAIKRRRLYISLRRGKFLKINTDNHNHKDTL